MCHWFALRSVGTIVYVVSLSRILLGRGEMMFGSEISVGEGAGNYRGGDVVVFRY